jgi:cytochrome P450
MWSYEDCSRILKSQQIRHSAFGCVQACIPDLFATNILIFLSNTGSSDSQWATIRQALHELFLNPASQSYHARVQNLSGLVQSDWPNAKLEDLNDVTLTQKLVSKCVFYVMFGKWIDNEDAEILIGWRTNATFFILPRLVQRFIFNLGIRKVQKLREGTVGIVEKYGLQPLFEEMNNSLGRWKRTPTVKLCDEIMYVIGFAGIGGTSACVESCVSFLQAKVPKEASASLINFGQYDTSVKMMSKYMEDPDSYIRETCRLDPPVTSATGVLKEVTQVTLAGQEFTMPAGLLNQYVVSMANRDPSVFQDPDLFNPDRVNLTRALTWNGAAFSADELSYPRICPGRYLSMDVAKVILNTATGHSSDLNTKLLTSGATPCC